MYFFFFVFFFSFIYNVLVTYFNILHTGPAVRELWKNSVMNFIELSLLFSGILALSPIQRSALRTQNLKVNHFNWVYLRPSSPSLDAIQSQSPEKSEFKREPY